MVDTLPKSKKKPRRKIKPRAKAVGPEHWSSKFTHEVKETIYGALLKGAFVETACRMAGIAKQTFYWWVEAGKDPMDPKHEYYKEFAEKVEKCQAISELKDLSIIEKAALEGEWKAAAWKLERRFQQRWGRKDVSIQVNEKSFQEQLVDELERYTKGEKQGPEDQGLVIETVATKLETE